MDDQEFRNEVIAHISAIEAVVTVLAKQMQQPALSQAVTQALNAITAPLPMPVHNRAESIARRMMGVED